MTVKSSAFKAVLKGKFALTANKAHGLYLQMFLLLNRKVIHIPDAYPFLISHSVDNFLCFFAFPSWQASPPLL